MACYTIKEQKDLWDYAKEKYLKYPLQRPLPVVQRAGGAGVPHPGVGYMDFKELTNRLSDDIWRATGGGTIDPRTGKLAINTATGKPFGRRIVPEDIAKMIAGRKVFRPHSKNLLLTDRNRRSMLHQARQFTAGTEQTPLGRFLRGAYRLPYTAKTLGHGPALHMTHAWPYALDPTMWPTFGKTWVNAWRAMKPSNARAFAEEIMLNPRFDEMIKAGLAVDPRAIYDDVEDKSQFLGVLGVMTKNSFLGLKQLRVLTYDHIYDRVPAHLQTEEMRELIANNVNHMTGAPGKHAAQAMSGKVGGFLRGVAFAPSLDIARVMRLYDIGHGVGITTRDLANKIPVMGDHLKKFWGASSPEEVWLARDNLKHWVYAAGVLASILYANQLVLKHVFNSNENINVDDPFSPDWMAGKGPNGRVWQFTGGTVPLIRTGIRMFLNPAQAPSILGNFILGKVNPALSIPIEYARGRTIGEAPIPHLESSPLEWTSYAAAELGPIATEEGIIEFAKIMSDQNGLPQWWNSSILEATRNAALVTIPAVLGTHTYQPSETRKTSIPAKPRAAKPAYKPAYPGLKKGGTGRGRPTRPTRARRFGE